MIESFVENLLNRGLPRSPRARELCRELSGKRVGVSVPGYTRRVLESTGDTLRISKDAAASIDAEISGGAVSLMALAGPRPEEVLQRGDVKITGDAELAQRFRELASLLRPDLEEELSVFVGDAPAHQLGNLARAMAGWGKRAADTTMRNAAEFLAHEKQDLVPRAEGDQFLKGVDALREDVDRLEARLGLIDRRGTE